MKAIHFGAGNIGRGFIGELLFDSGYEIIFVDVDKRLVDRLKTNKEYTIYYIGESESKTIKNCTALHSTDDKQDIINLIPEVDLITTSVGYGNLKHIVPTLVEGLVKREKNKPIDIIANENAINATDELSRLVSDYCSKAKIDLPDTIGYANSAIDRQALSIEEKSYIEPLVEPYYEWLIEDKKIKNPVNNRIHGAVYVEEIHPYISRKLYIVNAAHAAAAYLGALNGYQTVQEALKDKKIYEVIKEMLVENALFLSKKFQFNLVDLQQFIEKTLLRHGNDAIKDSVYRVGRSPIRKLQPNERLVGPFNESIALGLPTAAKEKVIVSALCYVDHEDKESLELQELLGKAGVKTVLKQLCHIANEDSLQHMESYFQSINNNH